MFPYLRTRSQFEQDYNTLIKNTNDNNDISDTIRDILIPSLGLDWSYNVNKKIITKSEYQSWGETIINLNTVLNEECSDSNKKSVHDKDIKIALEFLFDYRDSTNYRQKNNHIINLYGYNKRADLIIGGINKKNENVLVLVEAKRWETIKIHKDDSTNEAYIYYYDDKEEEEDNPSKQVKGYEEIVKNFEKGKNVNFKIYSFVWLYNCEEGSIDQEIKNELEKPLNKKDVILYKGQEVDFANKLNKIFDKKNEYDNNTIYELRKLFPTMKLHENIRNILDSKIYNNPSIEDVKWGIDGLKLKNKEKLYLTKDQYICLKKIISEIDNYDFESGEKKSVYIKGGVGSGKSILSILLYKYCKEKHKNEITKFIIPEGAPINAYKDNEQQVEVGLVSKFLRDIAELKRDSGDEGIGCDIAIVDEGHSLYTNQLEQITNNSKFVVFFYDNDQKSNEEMEEVKKVDFYLLSHFRCNKDDGYITFINDILTNKNEFSFGADCLDFNVKLINHQRFFAKKNLDKQYKILTGPKYKEKGKINYYSGKLFDYKSGIFVNELTNDFSGLDSIRGLESDKVIVIINKEEIRFDNDKRKVKVKDKCIENIYRVLFTRALQCCYIYCEDRALRNYLHKEKKIPYLNDDDYK